MALSLKAVFGDDDPLDPVMRARAPRGRIRPLSIRDGMRGTVRGIGMWPDRMRLQRITVKIRYRKGMATANGYLDYVTKEGKGLDGDRPEAFTRDQDGVDPVLVLQRWAREGDRLWWALEISPEVESPDPKRLVREALQQAGADLKTPLEYLAFVHHDSDRTNIHVMLRGRDGDGDPLLLDQEYVKFGFRKRFQEIHTYGEGIGLGERTGAQIQAGLLRSKEIRELRDDGLTLVEGLKREGLLTGRQAEHFARHLRRDTPKEVEGIIHDLSNRLRSQERGYVKSREQAIGRSRDDSLEL